MSEHENDKNRRRKRIRDAGVIAICLIAIGYQAYASVSRAIDEAREELKVGSAETSKAVLLLNTALERLERYETISAKVEFQSSFFGNVYYGQGVYKEKTASRSLGSSRPNAFEKTRFLLDAKIYEMGAASVDEENSLRIVCDCDASYWWSYSSVNGEKTLRRVSLEEFWNHFQQLDDEELASLKDSGLSTANCGLNNFPGMGGLSGMLRRVKSSFDFEPEIEQVTLGKIPCYKISGQVKERVLSAASRRLEADVRDPNNSDLLANIPTNAAVYFDQTNAFPCRIEYYSSIGDRQAPVRNDVFAIDYTLNNDVVTDADFDFDQPQSVFKNYEGELMKTYAPNVQY